MRLLMPATTAAVATLLLLLALDSGQGQISGLNIGTAAALGVAGMKLDWYIEVAGMRLDLHRSCWYETIDWYKSCRNETKI
jgi:hypothetical protein